MSQIETQPTESNNQPIKLPESTKLDNRTLSELLEDENNITREKNQSNESDPNRGRGKGGKGRMAANSFDDLHWEINGVNQHIEAVKRSIDESFSELNKKIQSLNNKINKQSQEKENIKKRKTEIIENEETKKIKINGEGIEIEINF